MNVAKTMLIAAFASAMSTGCTTEVVVPPSPPPPVVVNTPTSAPPTVVVNPVVIRETTFVTNTVVVTNVAVNSNSPQPVPVVKKEIRKPPQPAANTLALSLGGDTAGNEAPGDLLVALRTRFSQLGYVLVEPGKAHASAVVSMKTGVKASLDDWHVCEGEALVKIKVGGAKPLVREKGFEAVGERRLGKAQAEKAVVKPLCDAVSAWIEGILKERK